MKTRNEQWIAATLVIELMATMGDLHGLVKMRRCSKNLNQMVTDSMKNVESFTVHREMYMQGTRTIAILCPKIKVLRLTRCCNLESITDVITLSTNLETIELTHLSDVHFYWMHRDMKRRNAIFAAPINTVIMSHCVVSISMFDLLELFPSTHKVVLHKCTIIDDNITSFRLSKLSERKGVNVETYID
jgi:hypothetical protein